MTTSPDNIIKWARAAGLIGEWEHGYREYGMFAMDTDRDKLEEAMTKFAALVAEYEREECAKLHDHEDVLAPVGHSEYGETLQMGWSQGTGAYRDAIRARGDK